MRSTSATSTSTTSMTTERAQHSDRSMLMALRRLVQGERSLSKHDFRRRKLSTDASVPLYERRFGSWNKALLAAGLMATEQPFQLQGASPTCWSDQQMLAAIARCHEATDSTALLVYEHWRESHSPSHRRLHIPAASSIRYRFGRWSKAVALALATAQPAVPSQDHLAR